jgi:spore germination protein KB
MEKAIISSLQLFYILIGFELGTAIILGLGSGAKQDAWLVILVSTFAGVILMEIYLKLARFYPNDTLVEIIPKLIGKFLAYPVIVAYILYFIYIAGRVCRDLGELLVSTILVDTPIGVIIATFMVLVVYCLRGGIETLGRMGEVVFPIFLLSLMVIWILLLTVESFNPANLTPVLGNGVKPVLKEVLPKTLSFPFGETVIILMLLPFLKNKRKAAFTGFAVILISGIVLCVNSMLILSVLGPELYEKKFFPLLSATRLVSIADFLERFDALIILMMVAGVFFKVCGFTLCAALGIAQLVKVKKIDSVLIGLGTIITPLSLLIGGNLIIFLKTGLEIITNYVSPVMQIIFPSLFLCMAVIKNKNQTKKLS